MIENYYRDKHGIIHQKEIGHFSYDDKYIDYYKQEDPEFKRKAIMLYAMRYGFMVASNGGNIPGSVLDIGYGSGGFLEVCKIAGCETFGYDIVKPKETNHFTFIENFEDLFKRHFDVVTFFDAIEHFENIEWVKNLDCNIIVISVPWCHWEVKRITDNEPDADEWFTKWKHRKPNEHLHHFSGASLISFMKSMNYGVVSSVSNLEDSIRKPVEKDEYYSNIMTIAFKKLNELART